jgi:hypothetical protein
MMAQQNEDTPGLQGFQHDFHQHDDFVEKTGMIES